MAKEIFVLPPIVVTSAGYGVYVASGVGEEALSEEYARAAMSTIGNIEDLVAVDGVYVVALREGHPTSALELRASSDLMGAVRKAAESSGTVSGRLRLIMAKASEIENEGNKAEPE